MKWMCRNLVLLVVLLSLAIPAAAQEGPVTFEFSFSNPGARSMGLGGAFAAIADDATAAFSNPAGLNQLLKPEVSLEGRRWSYNTPFVAGGRASGEPTGIGLDTVSGPRYGVSSEALAGLSFLSFVYPGKKWSLAAYRHRWANFSLTRQVDSLFGIVDGELECLEDIFSTTDFKVTNNGFAAAYEMTPSLSLGFGMVYFQAEMDSLSDEFASDEEAFFEANPRLPESLDTSYHLRGKDSGVTLHAGFFWRPTAQWSVGGYFREGPQLTMEITEVVGPANDEAPAGTVELDATTPLNLPTVYGIGAAFRANEGALTISLEWDRVRYSSITKSLDTNVFDPGQINLSDGNEIHVGVEYVFVTAKPIVALRGGAWRDPAHGFDSGPAADVFEQTIFNGGDDEIHFSGGVGLVLSKFQFDLGLEGPAVILARLSILRESPCAIAGASL